jgi:hypothetical protein
MASTANNTVLFLFRAIFFYLILINRFSASSASLKVMTDPVVCADGHTYERAAIERWFSTHATSPKTNERLSSRALIPNHNLKAVLAAFKAREAK